MHLNYNEELHKFIQSIDGTKKRNLRKLNESIEPSILNDDKELCFVKINFYENGEIKDIFYPKEFNIDNMVYIDKITKLIIPKLSKNLYTENIDAKIDKLNKILQGIYEEEEEEEKIENTFLDNELHQEIFDENYESDKDLIANRENDVILRKNSESEKENFYNTDDLNNQSDSGDIINNDINESLSEGEIDKENSKSLNDEATKFVYKGIEENETFINITDFELENVESAHAKLDGSVLKRIKNSFIDEKGMLVFISESEDMTIVQPEGNSNELTMEEKKLKSDIYNENNFIPRNDDENFLGKDMSFNLSNIKTENLNNVSLYKNIINEELATNIFKYFDNFSYIRYNNEEDDKEKKIRILKEIKDDFLKENNDIDPSEIEIEHSKLLNKKKNKRNLQATSTYYGMKNIETEKILFKYNIIGLIIEGVVISKIDISTGICTSYLKIILGYINMSFKFKEMQTNMHIISKNSNQLAYNFIALLYYSNEDLIKRNQIYSDYIINLEKNVTDLFEKYYDYSGLFRDSLDDLYERVKNFSGGFFGELIELIGNVYDNYTIILNNAENNDYEIFNEIRRVTKNEYINYINKMFDLIIIFKNDTLLFLKNLKHEVDTIQTFQIDILYDIIDLLYESNLVLKDFIKKLFKAVDLGVTSFKYEMRDYIEEIIGELLYVTDFLSVNINKNEILKNVISLEEREKVTIKLKNFRNIILRIIEIINNNILTDYEEEMSTNNENSIKYTKIDIIQNCIEDLENKSNNITEEIKEKIQFMNYYESYGRDIQIINEITNKSFIEFNNDIYNYTSRNIQKIKPGFLNESNDLIILKNNLLNLSDNLINHINKEINQINNYTTTYYSKFINDNNYNLDYNLYNFRKSFTDEFLSLLLNDFKDIISDTFQKHYRQIIVNNYDLAYEYLDDVYFYLNQEEVKEFRILGRIFQDSYFNFFSTLQKSSPSILSFEFTNFISDNFRNVSKFVIKYINERLQSINKYYFKDMDKYEKNWYKLYLINKEIENLVSNINNYFNENFLLNYQQTISNYISESQSLFDKKNETLQNKYKDIMNLVGRIDYDYGGCDIIGVNVNKYRLWYTLFIAEKTEIEYYCKRNLWSRYNIDRIVKDLSQTKDYIKLKVNKLTNDYINKFKYYLNDYININLIQKFYDNLYEYTEERIQINENINLILIDYRNLVNNLLINNTKEKIVEKLNSNNNIDISNILYKLEENIFEMKNKFYQHYYLENKQFYLEYPEEILLKLNQTLNNLHLNTKVIKNKINIYFDNQIKNVISSTKLFINDINDFNLNYILHKINKDDIFDRYYSYKINLLKSFFSSLEAYLNTKQEITEKNELFLNQDNYDYFINKIENNYSDFSFN